MHNTVVSVTVFVSSQMLVPVPVSQISNYSFASLQLQACG